MGELIVNGSKSIVIGILALQGVFLEHQAMLQKLSLQAEISVKPIRSAQDLQTCDALVIPGGGLVPNPDYPSYASGEPLVPTHSHPYTSSSDASAASTKCA